MNALTTALGFAALVASAPPLADDLVGADKVLHAAASCAFTLAGYGGAALVDAPLPARLVLGVGLGASVGVAKEGFDALGGGTPSGGDLIYDALGVGIGVGLALAIDALWKPDRALPGEEPVAQP